MDEGDVAVFAEMGMSVGVGRFAVGSPACMCDAGGGGQVLVPAESLESLYLAFGFIDVKLSGGANERNSGAVVAAIFESVQTLDKNVVDIALAKIANNTTHI